MTKVLVTGAGGYIGNILVRQLLSHDYQVVAFDRYYFGFDPLQDLKDSPGLEVVKKDIRDANEQDFEGIDAVCDLAALSNDPSAEINPGLTREVNHAGRVNVATRAKAAGVKRYILSSSCSVYGTGQSSELTEQSPTGPTTAYAKSSLGAEEQTLTLADGSFCASALRNATVFGLSNRMRFDLVINLMTLHAVKKGRIIVMGGGKQWRPLVHVRDVACAFQTVLESPEEKVNGEVFNVGLRNYKISSLAYIVRETLPFPVTVELAPDDADKRDYNVSLDKAREVIGYEAVVDIPEGVEEIYDALKFGRVDDGPKTSTVGWYRGILDAQKLLESVRLGDRVL